MRENALNQSPKSMTGQQWIRILYRCWKDRTPYDEQVYLRSLQRHHSPLWLAVLSLSTQEVHG